MLHVLHHVLQNRVGDIADEQVMLRMTVRQKGREGVRVFSYHEAWFVFSVTHVKIRVFSYQDSCFQLPRFVFSVTMTSGKYLIIHRDFALSTGVTLYLTPI